MSMTQPVGVLRIGHWSYFATVIAAILSESLEKGMVRPPEHIRSLLIGAKDFFEPIRDYSEKKGHIPRNPEATLHTIFLYGHILRRMHPDKKLTFERVAAELVAIGDLVMTLGQPRAVQAEELDKFKLARQFFAEIKNCGDSENYTRVVGEPDYCYHKQIRTNSSV